MVNRKRLREIVSEEIDRHLALVISEEEGEVTRNGGALGKLEGYRNLFADYQRKLNGEIRGFRSSGELEDGSEISNFLGNCLRFTYSLVYALGNCIARNSLNEGFGDFNLSRWGINIPREYTDAHHDAINAFYAARNKFRSKNRSNQRTSGIDQNRPTHGTKTLKQLLSQDLKELYREYRALHSMNFDPRHTNTAYNMIEDANKLREDVANG